MKAILIVIALLGASRAHAGTVLVMSNEEDSNALRVAMAGRGVVVTAVPQPHGPVRLERAAVAQRSAHDMGALAAVWVDEADVCIVSADGHDFRSAPFPPQMGTPRAFAAIATSLLDEMLHPEPWAQELDVKVHVATAPRTAARAIAQERAHESEMLVELGPIASPISGGVSAAIMFPVAPAWKLGVNGSYNKGFVDGGFSGGVDRYGTVSVELRHVGRGEAHWDLGPEVGGLFVSDTDRSTLVGFRVARTWELGTTALSLGITPLYLFHWDDVGEYTGLAGVASTLRWQVPL